MSVDASTPPSGINNPTTEGDENFLVALWSSIFTPGATPTLLIATNITFGALQLVLFSLLIVTYSVHFFALSLISAALWWSINWFARELQASEEVQREQKKREKDRLERDKDGGKGSDGDEEGGAEWDEEVDRSQDLSALANTPIEGLRERSKRHTSVDTDTETETEEQGRRRRTMPMQRAIPPSDANNAHSLQQQSTTVAQEHQTGSSASGLSASEDEVLLTRPKSVASMSGDMSTDSEWEKVEE
ncbi:Pkr1-domain-containing protein [Viridothelium virens]|uniref:Pkr1-domain-containing protein n=1 Tax=Viridothelium virens TaxID=1048519 RepID=A0A6A6HJ07_VIRVR|nr:Pkr1-domain-containing protein [Viridothelium virens]